MMRRMLAAALSLACMSQVPTPAFAENSAPAPVLVVLVNFSFTPSDLQLEAGKPVALRFINQGSGGHNFVAKEFFAAAAIDAETRAKLGKKGVVELAKGGSMDVTLTPKAGSYAVQCTHFLHAGFGMTGTITVR